MGFLFIQMKHRFAIRHFDKIFLDNYATRSKTTLDTIKQKDVLAERCPSLGNEGKTIQ